MKQWLHDFLSHPWVDCKEAADGADAQPPTGGRGSPAPRKGSGTHQPKQSTQPAPHILLARRGSKGCWWAGMWPGVVWLVSVY